MAKQDCKTCIKEFEIRNEDMVFYEQVKTAPPLYCPECRMARRLLFRNERILYKRPCNLCQKDMVTLYSPESPYVVYCSRCWWSDDWNPKDYAMDYDPNKKFFDQYKELQLKVPRLGIVEIQNVRSEYTNGSAENKDCYLIFAADYNEDCLYGRLLQRNKQCVDCAFLHESELCYECIDCRECFKCMLSEQCQASTDLLFCYNLRNSNNCIFCTNGRNLSNSIFNIKYSKEEFELKKKEILKDSESIENAKKIFDELKSKTIRKFATQTKCHNVTGDHIHNCYDGVEIFDTYDAKNCSYMKDTEKPIDSMDCNNYYYKPQFGYNVMGVLEGSMLKNSAFVFYCSEIEYCENCHHLSNGFGCISIRKGNYMILNKEYSKEEYLSIRNKIEDELKNDGLFGQFFPLEIAPFTYNESLIQDFYPLTKEEAVKRGYRWSDKTTGAYGKETIKIGTLPNTTESINDNITNEILACEDCNKNYRLIDAEVAFYKKLGLPIPHKDFECRHKDRMKKRNSMRLYHRSCMKDGCINEFETTYSPDRKEIIYCELCYQQEVS